jgi:DNA-binding MarR family transcriptional regulator
MSTHRHAVTDLVLAVFRAHQALVNEGDRRVASIGLNSARWKVLGAIELGGTPLAAAEIGRRMGLTRQGAQKQLDALADEGLLERLDNPANRRVPLYATTARGRRDYARAEAIWTEWAHELGRGIPQARWRDATDLLDALARRIEEQAEEP